MRDMGGEVSLQLIAYHVRLLAEAGLLKLESTRPRRGAVEHFVIKRFHANADAFAHACGQGKIPPTS